MYPELTWQEEVLSKINTHLQHPLSLSEIALTPAWYGVSGRLRLAITPTEQSHYYAEEPVQVYVQRRDINKLFINHKPFINVTTSTPVVDCLMRLFKKYGLNIDTAIFDSSVLWQNVVVDENEKTISVPVVADYSESWYGTFQFIARKATSTDIGELFAIRAPLTSFYPEDYSQSGLHALNTYGIKLNVAAQDPIRSLSEGDSPKGHNAYRLAIALISMDYTLAWDLITKSVVVYNGKTADLNNLRDDPIYPFTAPPFGTYALVLEPGYDSGIGSRLYFSYD